MKRIVVALLVAGACVSVAKAQETLCVGWRIPAEEAKHWMMGRPSDSRTSARREDRVVVFRVPRRCRRR